MGYTVCRVGDAGGQKIAGRALPVEADHHFSIKVHALAERGTCGKLHHRRDRIDPKAAHAVFKLQGQRFNPDPDVRYPASVKARTGYGVIVNGLTGNQRLGVTLRQRQKTGEIFNGVLAVGIHLDCMSEATLCAGFQPRHYRRAFAAVFRQTQQRNLRMLLR